MISIFGVNVGQIVAQATAGQLPSGTLQKRASTNTYNASDPTAGSSPTFTPYKCTIVADKFEDVWDKQQMVRTTKFKAIVMLGSLPSGIAPDPGDKLVVTRQDTGATITATITSPVAIDPVGATATCSCAA